VKQSVEEIMACLGDEVVLRRLKSVYQGDDLDQAIVSSSHLKIKGGVISWEPGYLHKASLRLASAQILAYFRSEGGVSYSEAANILRLSVYLNKQTSIGSAAQRLCGAGWAVPFFFPADERFLAGREDSLRALVLEDLAPKLWAEGGWSEELQRQVSQTPLLEELSTTLALTRGDRFATLPSHLKTKGYLGLQIFLDGDSEAACAEWKRRVSRRKKGVPALPGLMGVFARLAALQCNDLPAFLDLRFSSPTFPWLDRFFQTLAGHLQAPLGGDAFAEAARLTECGPGLDALFWRATVARLPPLKVSPPQVKEKGLLAITKLLETTPLESPWRMWLDSLRRGTQSEIVRRAPNETEGYLSWRLWSNGVRGYRHAGEYDAGRPVDLAKLAKNPPDFLTLQDRIVLGKLHRDQLTAEAIRALIGHPHLSFETAPCVLVERPQKLHLEKSPEGLRLVLRPELKSDQPFLLRRLNERRVAFTTPSPWNPVLGPLLALKQAVPPEGEAELREILSRWAGGMRVECGPGVKPLMRSVVRPDRMVLRVFPRQGGLLLEWVARDDILAFPALRGPEQEIVRWNGQDCHVERDFHQEQRWLDQVWDRCPLLPRELELTLAELDPALELLEQLQAASVPLEWSEGKEWKVRGSVGSDSLSLTSLRGEGDWFEMTGSVRLDETRVLALGRALELARTYPGHYLQLKEGDFVRLNQRLRQQLNDLERLLEPHGQSLRLSSLAVPALEDIGIGDLHCDEKYAQVLNSFKEAHQFRATVPRTLQAELRDYQEVGFRWLAQRAKLGAGACLADDMGLGKTIQALALMIQEQAEGPALVVCPTSVTRHWSEQIEQFCPTLEPVLYEGPGRRKLLDGLRPGQVVIASYRVLLGDQRFLGPVDWHIALLDEAQTIKNPHSKTARVCFNLKAGIRIATTGTPIENRLAELWSLFRFLNPGLLGSLTSFRRRFESTFERSNRPRLRRLVAPFLLRRMKSDVLKELPERTELTLTVDLSTDERALYESVRRNIQDQLEEGHTMQLLAHLTRLRQACCHPRLLVPDSDVPSAKLAAFMELLDHLRAGNHRALVFSQFTSLLDLVEERLKSDSISYLRLDGATPAASRQARVSAFQSGQGDLFLISLKAGGTGLNLTAADYVVHLDPWWNPAAEDQATDRAHRIGQTRPVTVYRILARDTIEEKVLRLHGHKRDLARDILSGDQDQAPLGIQELRALVQR
jgi:SNF2 domain-containing protein/helicase-like protein